MSFSPTTCNGLSELHWKIYMKRWISHQLETNKERPIITNIKTFIGISQNVWLSCFFKSRTKCVSSYKGMCGLIYQRIDSPVKCEWRVHVPHSLCLNISVVKLPTSDPFSDSSFKLAIKDTNEKIFRIVRKYESINIYTNSSLITIEFTMANIIEEEDILISYQLCECNGVSLNMPVLYDKKIAKVPNNAPFYCVPSLDLTEYHLLLRVLPGHFLQIFYNCRLQKRDIEFAVFDGPSSHSPYIKPGCSGKRKVVKIAVSTFQAYVIIQIYNEIKNPIHLIYNSENQNEDNKEETISIEYGRDNWLSWDFTNSSSIEYRRILITRPIGEFQEYPIQYQLFIDQSKDSAQGYLCQYGGIILKMFAFNSPPYPNSQIGPICTREMASLLRDIQLSAYENKLYVILYHYGISFSQKGQIVFKQFQYNDSCIGALNPCFICESIFQQFVFTRWDSYVTMSCLATPTFNLIKHCIRTFVLANEVYNSNVSCMWYTSVAAPYTSDINIISKYTSLKPQGHCDVPITQLPIKVYNGKKKDGLRVQEQSYQYIAMHSSFVVQSQCSLREIFVATIYFILTSDCDAPTIEPIESSDHVPELVGICFNINLEVSIKAYTFQVYFLKEKVITDIYPSHFIMVAYIVNSNFSSSYFSELQLSVQDNSLVSNWSNLINISSRQLPLVWQSQGQYLKIHVSNNDQTHLSPIQLVIHLIADFELRSLSLAYNKNAVTIFQDCPSNGSHFTESTGTCFSIHQGLMSSWIDAENECQQRGGHLWSVNNELEWTEVMRSTNILVMNPIGFGGNLYYSINAESFLPLSSLLYLGLKKTSYMVSIQYNIQYN